MSEQEPSQPNNSQQEDLLAIINLLAGAAQAGRDWLSWEILF